MQDFPGYFRKLRCRGRNHLSIADNTDLGGDGSDTGIRQQQIQKSSKTEELLAFSFT
jgi:hypothetical protein